MINGNSVPRAVEFAGRLHAAILHPADLKLVRGRHTERLRWLDFAIAQIEPAYLQELARFQRCLKLRNAALKQSAPARELEALTENFASSSRLVVERRTRSWPALRDLVARTYASLSRGVEEFSAAYESDVDESFAGKLAALTSREREMQTTLAGPHRDRLAIGLGGLDASDSSSEGQARSLALALKMAQARFIRDRLGRPPVLLIDDVWNELDEARRKGLESLMAESPQILLTSTDASCKGIPDVAAAAAMWHVSAGSLKSQRPV
jgi:DNA replication and repair protein RecF